MTVRPIIEDPNRGLREVSCSIDDLRLPEVQALLDDLAETMYAAHAVGLSAVQIGRPLRAFVIDPANDTAPAELRYFVNPRIIASSRDMRTEREGCMSFPNAYERVSRFAAVTVWAQGRDGASFTLDVAGVLARGIQHECDHLDGVLYIDHMSHIARQLVERKMKKGRR